MAIFFLAVAVVIGFLLVRLANPADKLEPRWAAFLLELALGAGGGIALVSFLFFLLLMLHAASPLVMLPTEAVLLLTSAGLVLIRRRTAQDPCRRATGFWRYWILCRALVVSVLTIKWSFGAGPRTLVLDGQNDFLHLRGVDALEQKAKGRLCRSGILALGVTPDTKCSALRSSQAQTWRCPFARAEHRRGRVKKGSLTAATADRT